MDESQLDNEEPNLSVNDMNLLEDPINPNCHQSLVASRSNIHSNSYSSNSHSNTYGNTAVIEAVNSQSGCSENGLGLRMDADLMDEGTDGFRSAQDGDED